MSSYDVTLNSATRTNLLSLQNTASLAATNQQRLSTGKAVNSAIDNPVNYFTASALTDRATALSGLLDGISNGIQTIQAASKGIDGITSLVKSLQSTVTQAQADAATNRPTKTGLALSTAGEAVATNKGLKDVALSKTLSGSTPSGTPTAATSASAPGDLGVDNTTNTSIAISIKAGNTTYTQSFTGSSTLQDVVNGINSSGIANASVDDNGKLIVTGSGSDTLKVGFGSGTSAALAATDAASGTLNAKIGLATTDATTGISASGNSTVRTNLVSQFNSLTTQIDQLAKDSGYNGTNLLNGDLLTVAFNEKTGSSKSKLDVQGSTLNSASLGVLQATNGTATAGQFNIQNDSDLSTMKDTLTNALASLKSLSSNFGSALSTVQTRQDFTKNLSDVLTTGASNLTDADMNAEAAKSQALSTRQSLGISALSLANTASQGILQLLR